MRIAAVSMFMAVAIGGCVERTLTVRTDPPSAMLSLNGVEVGRTPFEHDFTWYGKYDVELRREGYETMKTAGRVNAPWWQIVPIDLLTELAPFELHDRQLLTFSLKPMSTASMDPKEMLRRSDNLRGKLESSDRTHAPIAPPELTKPTTAPATHP